MKSTLTTLFALSLCLAGCGKKNVEQTATKHQDHIRVGSPALETDESQPKNKELTGAEQTATKHQGHIKAGSPAPEADEPHPKPREPSEAEKPLPKDMPSMKALAENGDVRAQIDLGFRFRMGIGVKRDSIESAKWYLMAARQDNAKAQTIISHYYAVGHGVDKNMKESEEWNRKAVDGNRKAAQKGVAEAQYELGEMYKYGYGVKSDQKEMMKWYRAAAEQGYTKAQVALGTEYYGVERDSKESVKWFLKAAEQGDVFAQRMVSMSRRTQENKKNAWRVIAATNGDGPTEKYLTQNLSSDQIAKAKALAEVMIKKNPKLIKKKSN